jgi:tetratricopeptide (TPR) repeat protein
VDKAIAMLRLSLSLMARVPDHAKTEEADARSQLSLALAHAQQYQEAHDQFTAALQMYAASGEDAVKKAIVDQDRVVAGARDTTQAYENLARLYAEHGEPWKAIQTIDSGISIAGRNRDPMLPSLRLTRRVQLQNIVGSAFASDRAAIGAYVAPGSSLGQYLCAHNAYVVAASELKAGLDGELRRFRPRFPLVFAGPPTANGWYPVIVDAFVTCDEAGALIDQLQKEPALNKGAFVGQVLHGCAAGCPGLPSTVSVQK